MTRCLVAPLRVQGGMSCHTVRPLVSWVCSKITISGHAVCLLWGMIWLRACWWIIISRDPRATGNWEACLQFARDAVSGASALALAVAHLHTPCLLWGMGLSSSVCSSSLFCELPGRYLWLAFHRKVFFFLSLSPFFFPSLAVTVRVASLHITPSDCPQGHSDSPYPSKAAHTSCSLLCWWRTQPVVPISPGVAVRRVKFCDFIYLFFLPVSVPLIFQNCPQTHQ